MWHRARRQEGPSEWATFHDFRHFYASLLDRPGVQREGGPAAPRRPVRHGDPRHVRPPLAGQRRKYAQRRQRRDLRQLCGQRETIRPLVIPAAPFGPCLHSPVVGHDRAMNPRSILFGLSLSGLRIWTPGLDPSTPGVADVGLWSLASTGGPHPAAALSASVGLASVELVTPRRWVRVRLDRSTGRRWTVTSAMYEHRREDRARR